MPPPTSCCIHAWCMYSSLKQLRPSFYSVKRGVISQSHCTTVGKCSHLTLNQAKQTKTGWWFQPIWKLCSSNWIISPRFGVKMKKIFETTTPIPIPHPEVPPSSPTLQRSCTTLPGSRPWLAAYTKDVLSCNGGQKCLGGDTTVGWAPSRIVMEWHGEPINGGCQKWWYCSTMGFPTKNDHFGVFWGYHHLRNHPNGLINGFSLGWNITLLIG